MTSQGGSGSGNSEATCDEKYSRVRVGNGVFNGKIGSLKGGVGLMGALTFNKLIPPQPNPPTKTSGDALVLSVDMSDLSLASSVRGSGGVACLDDVDAQLGRCLEKING